jgi:hypothetical protein
MEQKRLRKAWRKHDRHLCLRCFVNSLGIPRSSVSSSSRWCWRRLKREFSFQSNKVRVLPTPLTDRTAPSTVSWAELGKRGQQRITRCLRNCKEWCRGMPCYATACIFNLKSCWKELKENWHCSTDYKSKSKLLYDWRSVSQSVCVGVGHPLGAYNQILLFPFFFAGKLFCSSSWGALSDERMGL